MGSAGLATVNAMVNSSQELDRTLVALAHPIRRRLVERLAQGPATVAQASAGIPVSKPAITRHLRLLEQADVVVRVVEGRSHRLSLNEAPLTGLSGWVERQRALWERKFAVIDDYLEERR